MKVLLLALFNLTFTHTALTQSIVKSVADPTKKPTIVLSISNSIPPYNMIDEKIPDYPGIQVEIVDLVFKRLGYKVDWRTMTNNRAFNEMRSGHIDGSLNNSSIIDERATGKYYNSLDIIDFENCLIGPLSKKKSFTKIDKFYAQLKRNPKIRLIGFQGASITFKEVLPNLLTLKNYDEVPHQKTLAATLLAGRTNYILSDYQVFKYYATKVKPALNSNTKDSFTCLHRIPSGPHNVTFRDNTIRKNFDLEMQKLIDSGEKEKIIKKYQLFLTQYLKKGAGLMPMHQNIAEATNRNEISTNPAGNSPLVVSD